MEYVALGKTNLLVSRTALSVRALCTVDTIDMTADDGADARVIAAEKILRTAYDAGINFFDAGIYTDDGSPTAHTDVLAELALTFLDKRKNIVLAAGIRADTDADVTARISDTLQTLQTDYIDILYLLHPAALPQADAPDGILTALDAALREGKIRHAGFSTASVALAAKMPYPSRFDTLFYPYNAVSATDATTANAIAACHKRGIDCVSFDPLPSGMSMTQAFRFFRSTDTAIPLWRVASSAQLAELLQLEASAE